MAAASIGLSSVATVRVSAIVIGPRTRRLTRFDHTSISQKAPTEIRTEAPMNLRSALSRPCAATRAVISRDP